MSWFHEKGVRVHFWASFFIHFVSDIHSILFVQYEHFKALRELKYAIAPTEACVVTLKWNGNIKAIKFKKTLLVNSIFSKEIKISL